MKKQHIKLDKMIVSIFFILTFLGLYMQFIYWSSKPDMNQFFKRNVPFAVVSIIILFVCSYLDFKILNNFLHLSFYIAVILTALAVFSGGEIKGANRSINILDLFRLQPSAISLPFLVFLVSNEIVKRQKVILSFKLPKKGGVLKKKWIYLWHFIKSFPIPLLACSLLWGIVLYGTHLSVIILSALVMFWLFFYGNANRKVLITLTVTFSLLGLLTITGFRAERLKTFRFYNIYKRMAFGKMDKIPMLNEYRQSREGLIAMSFGSVIGETPMSKFKYLSEPHTDYVFSTIGEIKGIVGSVIILILYAILFFRSMHYAFNEKKDLYKQLIIIGLSLHTYLTAMGHIGVNILTVPPTGIVLPLMSAGGTAIFVHAACIGVILNLTKRPVPVKK